MTIRWRPFLIHGALWLLTEVFLSMMDVEGLNMDVDDLADYSEFIFHPIEIVWC